MEGWKMWLLSTVDFIGYLSLNIGAFINNPSVIGSAALLNVKLGLIRWKGM